MIDGGFVKQDETIRFARQGQPYTRLMRSPDTKLVEESLALAAKVEMRELRGIISCCGGSL